MGAAWKMGAAWISPMTDAPEEHAPGTVVGCDDDEVDARVDVGLKSSQGYRSHVPLGLPDAARFQNTLKLASSGRG